MSLLPNGKYRCLLHRLYKVDDRVLLDFTELQEGERHVLRLFPINVARLSVALIRHGGSLKRVSGQQVEIEVVVKVDGERAFNAVRRITPVDRLPGVETSVPVELPTFSFEDWETA